MEHLTKEFIDYLTDRQLIVFCLFFGYNERGITLGYTEIANLLNAKVESIYQSMEQISFKLSQNRFRPLVDEMNQYSESYETISN